MPRALHFVNDRYPAVRLEGGDRARSGFRRNQPERYGHFQRPQYPPSSGGPGLPDGERISTRAFTHPPSRVPDAPDLGGGTGRAVPDGDPVVPRAGVPPAGVCRAFRRFFGVDDPAVIAVFRRVTCGVSHGGQAWGGCQDGSHEVSDLHFSLHRRIRCANCTAEMLFTQKVDTRKMCV